MTMSDRSAVLRLQSLHFGPYCGKLRLLERYAPLFRASMLEQQHTSYAPEIFRHPIDVGMTTIMSELFYHFPKSVSELEAELCIIAIDRCFWPCFDPSRNLFFKKCHSRKFREAQYWSFGIPRRAGSVRNITAPVGTFKELQKSLAFYISSFYCAPRPVNGFTAGRSVYTNAVAHCGKDYVFNTDLENFFPSITAKMVLDCMVKRGVAPKVARYISELCTLKGVLTQGSPTSPIISNFVCYDMDVELMGLAQLYGLTYTRYADDMTFSGDNDVYPEGGKFRTRLRDIISSYGFKVNGAKTRLQKKGARQEVTGLTVGEKVNVSRKYLKNLRAEIFRMETMGFSRKEYRQVRGKLAYVSMVRGKDDPCSQKLGARLRQIRNHPAGIANER